jgi:hypothetical protein
MRILLSALVLSCSITAAAPAQQAESARQSSRPGVATVRVVNRTTEQLRVSGRGASSARISAGGSACIKVRSNGGETTLTVEIVGTDDAGVNAGRSSAPDESGSNARGSGRVTFRSEAFTPSAAPGWDWTIAAFTSDQTQVVPVTTPCSA